MTAKRQIIWRLQEVLRCIITSEQNALNVNKGRILTELRDPCRHFRHRRLPPVLFQRHPAASAYVTPLLLLLLSCSCIRYIFSLFSNHMNKTSKSLSFCFTVSLSLSLSLLASLHRYPPPHICCLHSFSFSSSCPLSLTFSPFSPPLLSHALLLTPPLTR